MTDALHILEGLGYIRSTRGLVVIIDREGLIGEAINAYGHPEAEYRRLTGIQVRKHYPLETAALVV